MKKKTIQTQAVSTLFRSSHQMYSAKKVFLQISQNSQENTCARDSFFKVAGLRQISKNTPFLQNTFGQLLLTFNRFQFKKTLLMTPFHCIISNFEKKIVLLLTKDFFY